jgi:hypothetical protein
MSKVSTKPPLGLKAEKPPKKPRKGLRGVSRKRAAYRASEAGKAGLAHMAKVKQLPCVICDSFGMRQNSPTEVHHCKSGRYGNLRTHDRCTIPLCHSHHNKLVPHPGDETKVGFHNNQRAWEDLYGPDHQYIAVTLDKVEAMV